MIKLKHIRADGSEVYKEYPKDSSTVRLEPFIQGDKLRIGIKQEDGSHFWVAGIEMSELKEIGSPKALLDLLWPTLSSIWDQAKKE